MDQEFEKSINGSEDELDIETQMKQECIYMLCSKLSSALTLRWYKIGWSNNPKKWKTISKVLGKWKPSIGFKPRGEIERAANWSLKQINDSYQYGGDRRHCQNRFGWVTEWVITSYIIICCSWTLPNSKKSSKTKYRRTKVWSKGLYHDIMISWRTCGSC